MFRLIKIFLIFEIGLLISIFVLSPKTTPKSLPVFSKLPDITIENNLFSIIFTGDVMLGRSVNTRIQKYKDTSWPFKNITNILSSADLTIINLESPFVEGCNPTDSGMLFCADPKNVQGLVSTGVDVATIANNHIENYGKKGIEDTNSILKTNNILPIEANQTGFKTINNIKIAIITFSDFPSMDFNTLKSQIVKAKNSADLVITTFHWGVEYQKYPTNRQIEMAHLAINSGSDVVVGHHPHVVQTEETYQGKPIYYSLGNLVFDQMWSEETRNGQILKITFEKTLPIKKEIIPIKIFNYGQPSSI